MRVYDVLIIGGGPAGLSALHNLTCNGYQALLFERGSHYQNRLQQTSPYNIANGLGGAGLLSDGKYSFSPAASSFWRNINVSIAEIAYEKVRRIVLHSGVNFPNWDNDWANVSDRYDGVKEYNTIYSSQQEQTIIVDYMYNRHNVYLDTEITCISKHGDAYFVRDNNGHCHYGKNIILSTGKHGANLLRSSNIGCKFDYKIEAGVRVECSTQTFLPYLEKSIDYKRIEAVDSHTQIRTFCCCKTGRVVQSFSDGFHSYNGIKDRHAENSNIGVLIRSEDPQSVYATEFVRTIPNMIPTASSLALFLNGFHSLFGSNDDNLIKSFILKIVDSTNCLALESALIYSPEVEYFGYYPCFETNSLKIANEHVWISGDVSGKYRGLLAALMSGIYVSEEIIREGY